MEEAKTKTKYGHKETQRALSLIVMSLPTPKLWNMNSMQAPHTAPTRK